MTNYKKQHKTTTLWDKTKINDNGQQRQARTDRTICCFLRSGIGKFLEHFESKKLLRTKQRKALNALIAPQFSNAQIAQSYYKLPTGFGKTVIFSFLSKKYLDEAHIAGIYKKVLIVVPRLVLISQTQVHISKFAQLKLSVFDVDTKNVDSDIIISTYQSLDKLIKKIGIDNIGMVFADEAPHILGSKQL